MIKFIQSKLFLIVLALLALQCQRERDMYYEAPPWIGEPIYTLLEQEGRFDMYLRVVDKSMYLTSFKGNGYWTVFAPNNAAMEEYLKDKKYSSVDDISEEEANRLVAYNMLYNKYVLNRLPDVLNGGWDTLQSIKKQTPYYEDLSRKLYKGSDSAWIANPTGPFGFNTAQRSYKFLPFYLTKVFEGAKELSAKDYKLFYPNTEYTGSNVQGAIILNKEDMIAANGVVHEVSRVNEPLPNLEDILVERGSSGFSGGRSYSRFKNLIFDTKNDQDETFFIQYGQTPGIDDYFRRLYPSRGIDRVLVKYFVFETQINCERPSFEYGVETEGYTLLAPTNEAIERFENDKLQPYGKTLESLPNPLKLSFIRAHMAAKMVWPNQFYDAFNEEKSYINGRKGAKGEGYSCVEQFPASNGLFYGVDTVIKSPDFETVFTEIQMRPEYEYMYQALNLVLPNLVNDLLKCRHNAYENEHYLVLLPTNQLLQDDGFGLETSTGESYFTHSRLSGSGSEAITNRLRRLVRSHIFRRYALSPDDDPSKKISTQIDDFTGGQVNGYNGYSYAINDYGDVVRYKNNQLEMISNYANNEVVTAEHIEDFSNGAVFGIDKLLQYSSRAPYAEDSVVTYIRKAAQDNPNVSEAAKYFDLFANNKIVINGETVQRENLPLANGQYWTVLLPTDSALVRAYHYNYSGTTASGVTYGNATSNRTDLLFPPNMLRILLDDPTNRERGVEELRKAIEFFRYHVIPGFVYVDDDYSHVLLSSGVTHKEALAATARKVEIVKSTFLEVDKGEYPEINPCLRFSPYQAKKANSVKVIRGVNRSNLFAPMGIVHEVDGLLRYKQPEN